MSQLGDTLKGIIQISKGSIKILNSERVRGVLIDRLFETAILHEKVEMRGVARWIIKMTAQHFGIYFSPVEMLYKMIKLETNEKMALPVFSVGREMRYKSTQVVFLAAIQMETGIFLFQFQFEENAPDEKQMIDSLEKQKVMIIAAAIQADFTGPIFFTSDRMGSSGVSILDFSGFSIGTDGGSLALFGENEAKRKDAVIKIFNRCQVMKTREKVKPLTQGRDVIYTLRNEIAVAVAESSKTHGQTFIESFCSADQSTQL
ncbi:MAG: hypothetical protein ACE5FY_06235 [Nitrospiria bacterium]